jgi:Flp pilus assembly protein TadG
MNMSIGIPAPVQEIVRRRRGSVAIQIGLAMIVILGMVALGTEITFVMFKHRQMQSAADSAAFGAGTAIAKGYPVDYALEANAIAAEAGFVNGASEVTIAVNRPPASGPHSTNASAVEVIITQPQTLNLVALFRSGLFNLQVRAVAIQGEVSSYCVLGLDPTASGTVRIMENGIVASETCGVGVNSNSNSALIMENNAIIKGPVSVVGDWSLANNASIPTDPAPKNHAAGLTDPYATVPLDATGAPARTQPTGCSTCSLLPGRYAAGLNYSNNVTLNLAAGVYYIDSQLSFQNNVIINANSGVTLVINGNYELNIGNNVTINITAPTSGATAGLAFASTRTATASKTQKFSNNAILNLTGAIYFPNQIVQFDNNSTINTAKCGQLIARIVQIQNNANLKNNCAGTGVLPITGGSTPQLVE